MTAGESLLELVDVTKQYESPDDDESAQVLRGVSLSVAAGERLGIVGRVKNPIGIPQDPLVPARQEKIPQGGRRIGGQ